MKIDLKKITFLIVDDNESLAEGLKKYFIHRGYAAETIHSVNQLTERMSGQAPTAIVLDIFLGYENGIELLPKIKMNWPDCPVIILTGKGYDEQLMQSAREAGAQGFISKRTPPDQLLATVLGILEHPEHHS